MRAIDIITVIQEGAEDVNSIARALGVKHTHSAMRTLLAELIDDGTLQKFDDEKVRLTPGPRFDYVAGKFPDENKIFEVWANGYALLHSGTERFEHPGVYVGRVWEQEPYGWVAAPRRTDDRVDTWPDEVNRSVRHFLNQREASVFLWGYDQGIRRPAYEAAMAKLPGTTRGESGWATETQST